MKERKESEGEGKKKREGETRMKRRVNCGSKS